MKETYWIMELFMHKEVFGLMRVSCDSFKCNGFDFNLLKAILVTYMCISYWAIIYILYYIIILPEINKQKANWIGQILLRNCLLQRVIEGKIKGEIEVTGRRGRRRRKLLDDLKERRGYFHLKEEALDRTVWRARFGRGFGSVVKQILMKE